MGRAASGRLIYIDKETADRVAEANGTFPRVSDMPLHFPVLVIGSGVPSFKVEHVSAALKARGVRGYWLVERQERPRAPAGRPLAETLIGFPGLHIARIGSPTDL